MSSGQYTTYLKVRGKLMIPRTFPNTRANNNEIQMVVFILSSVEGLQKWVDYIPVQWATQFPAQENSYNKNGFINITRLSQLSASSKPFKDYVPVFIDNNATEPWTTNNKGYIPIGQSTFGGASLGLDFTFGETLDPRITFTRASSATRYNAAGVLETVPSNIPRFDYDPVTLAPKGLLIEEQRSNAFTWSEQLENVAWTNSNNTVTSNAIISPDGTQDADKIVENTAAGVAHEIRTPSVTLTSGVTYTASIYAKIGERRYLRFGYSSAWGTSNNYAVFDLQDGSNTYKSNAGLVTTSTFVGNGWYRLTVTYAVTATSTSTMYIGINTNATTGTTYTGDGTSGLFLWGAQLEAGLFPTSYIPTTTAQATRAADVAVMTGTNFSSWYRQDEGTLFAEISATGIPINSSVPVSLIKATPGDISERLIVGQLLNTTVIRAGAVGSNNIDTAVLTSSKTAVVNVPYKSSISVGLNDIKGAVNGLSVTGDTSSPVPAVNLLMLGSLGYQQFFNGHIRRIAYYPRRLSNTELQALTA